MFARPAGKFQASRRGKPARRILGLGCGKTMGGLFWPQKNLGRAIWAAEKPWVGYFGRGKTMRTRTFWKFDIQTL